MSEEDIWYIAFGQKDGQTNYIGQFGSIASALCYFLYTPEHNDKYISVVKMDRASGRLLNVKMFLPKRLTFLQKVRKMISWLFS